MRRLLGGAVVLAMLLMAPAAHAAVEAELGFVKIAGRNVGLVSTDANGGSPKNLLGPSTPGSPVPLFISAPSWTGDGDSFLFVGGPGERQEESEARGFHLYAVPAEGGVSTPIPHTTNSLFPIGLPDGESVAVVKVRGHDSEEQSTELGKKGSHVVHQSRSRSSIWIIRLDGGAPRQVTPRTADEELIPDSVSPDGRTLAVHRIDLSERRRKKPHTFVRLTLLNLADGHERALPRDVAGVAFSPDGTREAIVKEVLFPHPHVVRTKSGALTTFGQTDIYVKDLATGALTPIAVGPSSDGNPSWDPSGERLSFIRLGNLQKSEKAALGIDDSVYEANADGTCLTRVLSQKGVGFVGPSWRPGAEHAAGPINC